VTEEQLSPFRSSRQHFSTMFELAPVAMVLTSVSEGLLLEVNREFLNAFGFSREEVIGRTAAELPLWVNPDDYIRYLRMVGEDKYVNYFEVTMRTRTGELMAARLSGSLLTIDGARYALHTVFDSTRQKTAKQTFPESESRFRNFFEQSGDAFLILDMDRFVDCNDAAIQLLGYDGKQDIVSHSLAEISPERQPDGTPSLEKAQELIAHAFSAGGHRFEWTHLKADGTELPVEVSLTPMSLGGTWLLHVIWRDISQRKQVEFREQTRLNILEQMASGAALPCLLNDIVMFVEKNCPGALCSILIADDECTRLHHGAAPSLPDYYNTAVNGLRIRQGMGSCGTAAFLRTRVIVEDTTVHPYWKGFAPVLQAGLQSCWSEPVMSPEGQLLGTFATYHREPRAPGSNEIALIESAAHLASIAIGWARDNERRNALEEHVRQMQKMEAVGQLAGGIAHDFNNLLTPILGYAEIIRTILAEEHPCQQKIDRIIAATIKSRDLVQKLLSFSRKQNLAMTNIDLNRVIDSFKDIIRHTIRANIAVVVQLAPDGAQILADHGQMEQVLLNLAVNAQDAIAGNGTITITTGHVTIDDGYVKLNPGVKPGAYILLEFADDGCGMPDDVVQHIFEPFYTTKPAGRGTGLGLATTFGIIRQHGGHIKVRSRLGEGTTFSIYFPENVSAVRAAAGQLADLHRHDRHDKTILFVDDNEMILEMVEGFLEMYGYQVLTAATPTKALDMAAAHAGSIDLLITDVVMPEMNGPELYERLAAQFSEIPVLYISGYKKDVVLRGDKAVFVAKPFTAEQLLGSIQMVLNEGQAG
jgi:two-component system, cell cycle sensor histidine kinase and response regulator CckA